MAVKASASIPVDSDQGGARYVFPATFSQQRLWFLDQLNPGDLSYLIPWSIHLTGSLDAEALARALNEIVARHEILRTTFSADGEDVSQVVSESLRIPVPVIDLTERPDAEAEARRRQAAEAGKPLDLERGPLVRAQLLRVEPTVHVLLLTLHHIIFDRWSRGIFTGELAALYEAFRDGERSPLEPIQLQYADFAVWQRDHLQGKVLEDHLAYWRKQLAGAPAELALPFDRPRPAELSSRGTEKLFQLPEQLSARLEEFSRRHEVTLFMTLLAAFHALLARYSGQDDIVVGAPIANRNRQELEGLIGFFANTLVLRTDLSGNPSFRDLLSRVKTATLDAYRHQDLPFERLVQELNPERRLNYNPVFQVLFSLGNVPGQALELKDLELRWGGLPGTTAKFDLSLVMRQQDGLSGVLQYNTDLFDESTIGRMIDHFLTLLEGVVDQPALPVATIPLLSPEERHELLVEWNSTQCDYPPLCVHEWFDQRARSKPEGIALIAGGRELTYAELNVCANQVAQLLRKHGAGPDVLVGICTDRSFEMVIAVLGVLKAGAAYVPLDPDYPADRLAFIIEDAGVRLLLTQQTLASSVPSFSGKTIYLDADRHEISLASDENLDGAGDPEQLAYVLYTSGSTGKPKGVQITHRNVVNFLASMQERPGIGESDSLLAVTTLSFDIAGLELFLPLVTGATVILATRDEARDGRQLIGLMDRWKPTILQATPATWWILLESGWEGNPRLKALCGGEALPGPLAAKLIPRCRELWNMYGPTETTIWSTIHPVTEAPAGVTTIGRPIANTRAYVLDSALQPVPVGVVGELYLGGHGVARGYLNRPELNSQKFLSDPFVESDRMYRTGDLARYRSNGNLEYLGRADDQVKIRGFRIELGEIESTLDEHPEVKQSVVVVREDEPGRKQIVAYVLLQPSPVANAKDLGHHLRKALPAHMVPVAFVMLDTFPLTANGKVDRKALPPPQQRQEVSEYVGPRTPAEEKMTAIWSDLLRLPQVGIRDDFFTVGGHSLLAVELFSRIEREFGVKLPLNLLFTARSIEELVSRIGEKDWTPEESSLKPCRTAGSRLPIYAAHGIGGTVLTFRTLVKYLEPDQPVYCLEALGFDRLWNSLEDLAAIYIQDVRAFQPEGPYHLIGSSFGGMVVFEMARQLEAQGQEVGLVGLLDSYNLGDLNRKRRRDRFIKTLDFVSARGKLHLKRLVSRRASEWPRYAVGRLLAVGRRIYGRLWRLAYRSYKTAPANKPSPLRNLKRVYELAGMDYVPKQYAGKIVLFRTDRSVSNPKADPTRGWSGMAAGGLEIINIPGDHNSMLSDPHVPVLAAEITQCLARYTAGEMRREERQNEMVGSS